MKLLSDRTTLIIAGAWNPAIVNPNWIGREILKYPLDKQFTVGIALPIQDMSVAGVQPRLTFETLSMTATAQSLTFFIDAANEVQIAKTFEVASKVLRTLSHTPVVALGINFGYSIGMFCKRVEAAFTSNSSLLEAVGDQHGVAAQQSWSVALQLNDHLLNVAYTDQKDNKEVTLNHHFESGGSASTAAEILERPGLFGSMLKLSEQTVEVLEQQGDDHG